MNQWTAYIKRTQTELKTAGYYTGKIDGLWGPLSEGAVTEALESIESLIKLSKRQKAVKRQSCFERAFG